jgi:drug/metabolite transporter (DMT)-like permease
MTRNYAILAIGVISVSFSAILIRFAGAPPLVVGAYRLCIAFLILLPLAWTRSRGELRRLSRKEILMALLSGVFLALHFGLWIASLSYTSVATSVVLVTINPIFLAIASHLFFGEQLRRQTFIGVIICFVGGILIVYGNWRLGINPFLGGLLALLGAIAAAGYLLIGRRLRQNIGLLSYTCIAYGSAGLLLLLTALILDNPLSGYSTKTYVMLVLLALVPQLLGHSSLNWSLRFISATSVAIAILGEPIGATVWALLLLDEVPTPMEIIGGVLILAGIFVALRKTRIPLLR